MSDVPRKHPCPDCRACQWCGDDRCRLCRRPAAAGGRKLTMAEQIARYESLNRRCRVPAPPMGHGAG
jgi:hypothetical protein